MALIAACAWPEIKPANFLLILNLTITFFIASCFNKENTVIAKGAGLKGSVIKMKRIRNTMYIEVFL